jgi:hypothetical protein
MWLAVQKGCPLTLEDVEDFVTVPVSQVRGGAGAALEDPQRDRLGPHAAPDVPPDPQIATLEGLAFFEPSHEAPSLE